MAMIPERCDIALKRAHPVVRSAYAYTDDEVEYLWGFYEAGPGEYMTPMEIVPLEGPVKQGLLEKLWIKDKDTPSGNFRDSGPHQDAKRTFRDQQLFDFATWLFTGEAPRIVLEVPKIIECAAFPVGCGRQFEKAAFPYWPTDKRCSSCIHTACHPSLGNHKRTLAVSRLHRLMGVARSKQIDTELARFARTFSRFVQFEGDVEGVAKHWHDWFEMMRKEKPTSATLGQANLAIMKIWMTLDEHRDAQQNFEDMKDEELKEFIAQQKIGRLTREQITEFVNASQEEVVPLLDTAAGEEVYAEAKYSQSR